VPSPEEAAAIGGADGQAGRDQEQQSRGFDINAAIREGSAIRKLKKQGRL
jgi:hypothetical protein